MAEAYQRALREAEVLDVAAIRAAITTELAAAMPGLNVYAYPDPQVEYPAFTLPEFEGLVFHASLGCHGVAFAWTAELLVAGAEVVSALEQLEQLVPLVALALENMPVDGAPFAQLNVARADNVRKRGEQGAYSADLVLEVHA